MIINWSIGEKQVVTFDPTSDCFDYISNESSWRDFFIDTSERTTNWLDSRQFPVHYPNTSTEITHDIKTIIKPTTLTYSQNSDRDLILLVNVSPCIEEINVDDIRVFENLEQETPDVGFFYVEGSHSLKNFYDNSFEDLMIKNLMIENLTKDLEEVIDYVGKGSKNTAAVISNSGNNQVYHLVADSVTLTWKLDGLIISGATLFGSYRVIYLPANALDGVDLCFYLF